MNEYTVMLIVIALVSLVAMMYKLHPAILLTTTTAGMGGLYSVITDFNSGEITSGAVGAFLSILMLIAVLYSISGWFTLITENGGRRRR